MKDLFFVIPTEKSLSVISLGSSLLFAWILTIVFTFECPILYLQSIYKLSEEASITVTVTLGLTSLFMIVASICLKKFNLYLTWMICTVVTFLIQTAVIMWLVAVNGVTIFEWSLFPYTTRTVLAKLELLLILVHLLCGQKFPCSGSASTHCTRIVTPTCWRARPYLQTFLSSVKRRRMP